LKLNRGTMNKVLARRKKEAN
ncbi:Fis family transcriptional regulator, partial [Acinetobacter baumannii]|nr:Fis family transcriptional regulator [Acinetobacter baumannii]